MGADKHEISIDLNLGTVLLLVLLAATYRIVRISAWEILVKPTFCTSIDIWIAIQILIVQEAQVEWHTIVVADTIDMTISIVVMSEAVSIAVVISVAEGVASVMHLEWWRHKREISVDI